MKILLIFTVCLISGTGNSFNVIGYSGGSVIIHSDLQWSLKGAKYICQARNGCIDIINDQSGNKNIYHLRFSLHENTTGMFTVWIRDLEPRDAAKYEFGVKEEKSNKSKEIELKVKNDCCGGAKVLNAYLGENVTIKCKYPDIFEENDKVFFKLENRSITEIINTGKESQKVQRGRFSISEDRSSKVFSVRISDVREDDGGVYYCGVWKKEPSDGYHSLYTEIQLQVTASSSSVIIITVCVALLLIGGLALIYKLRCKKTHGSSSISKRSGTNNTANNADEQNNISMSPVNQSDSVYQNLNPNTNQSECVYQSLNPDTSQSDSVYQSLNPDTSQSDSVYQSLNPNTNQSESVYQSINPDTNQSDSVYQSLNPNTNQSNAAYKSLNANNKQSNSVY